MEQPTHRPPQPSRRLPRALALSLFALPTLTAAAPQHTAAHAATGDVCDVVRTDAAGPRDRPIIQRAPALVLPSTATRMAAEPPHVDVSARLHRVFHDTAIDGSQLVWTPKYKATVSGDGLVYRPFLGSDAPTTYPIQLSLDRVSIDGEEVHFDRAPRVTRERDRITLSRGALDECYDFEVDSVEQSFVLPDGTRGEVIVEVDLALDPAYTWSPASRTWQHERGVVSLSEAVVFTEGGQELSIPCDVEDGRMSMRVPAAFLERAEGAIVIDPIISTGSIGTAMSEWIPDSSAAYDPPTDRYCVSLGIYFAQDDRDSLSVLVSGTTAQTSGLAFLEMSSADVSFPTTGGNAASSSFLHALLVGPADSGPFELVGRTRDAASGTLSAPFVIQDGTAGRRFYSFALGSDPYPAGPTYYLLAIVEEVDHPTFGTRYELFVQLLDQDGQRHGPRRPIDSSTGYMRPHLTPTMGAPFGAMEWVLLYERPNQWVRGATFSYDGSIRSGPTLVTDRPIDLQAMSSPTGMIDPASTRPTTLAFGEQSVIPGASGVMMVANLRVLGERAVTDDSWVASREREVVSSSPVAGFAALFDGWATWGWLRAAGPDRSFVRVLQPIEGAFGSAGPPEEFETPLAAGGTSEYEWGGARARRALIIRFDLDDAGTLLFVPTLFEFGTEEAAGSMHCAGADSSTGEPTYLTASGDRGTMGAKTLHLTNLPVGGIGYMLFGFDPLTPSIVGPERICIGNGYDYLRGAYPTGDTGSLEIVVDPTAIRLTAAGTLSAISGETHNFQFWARDATSLAISNAVSVTYQ